MYRVGCQVVVVLLLLIAPVASSAAEVTYESAIQKIESLTAAESLDDSSYLDLALAANQVILPKLDAAAVRKQLAVIAADARKAWDNDKTPQQNAAALSQVIFRKHGFATPRTPPGMITGADTEKYYALPGVLKGKLGHCEGLSTLYRLVAEEAGLPVSIVNVPTHTVCTVGAGRQLVYVECTRRGDVEAGSRLNRINGIKAAAATKSDTYLTPLSKRQFLNLQLNALIYGLAMQKKGPAPLTQAQMVRLANCIEQLDPSRPESLETAALIHYTAGDEEKALQVIRRAEKAASTLGAPGWAMDYYRKKLKKYEAATF